MKKLFDPPKRDRWARLRFSVIGPLMASPPEPGGLRDALLIDEQTYGPTLAQTAQVGIRLAICLQSAGRNEEANDLFGRYRGALLGSANGSYDEERKWLNAHPARAKAA